MPLFYRFLKDGELVPLAKIDDMICEAFGIQANPDKFSLGFTMVCAIGDAALASGEWNEAVFVKAVDGNSQIEAIARRFLRDEFTYECWFDRKRDSDE